MSVYSYYETLHWKDNLSFAKNNFERTTNCKSGLFLARLSYIEQQSIGPDLKAFLITNKCLQGSINPNKSNYILNEYYTVLSYFIYFEKDYGRDEKLAVLKKLSAHHYLPIIMLAALNIEKNNYSEANRLIQFLIDTSEKKIPYNYEPVSAKVIMPYCIREKKIDFINFMNFFSHHPDMTGLSKSND
jgi:hypothetical protein